LQKWALDPESARALRHSRPGDTGRAGSEGGGVVGVGVGVPEKGRDGDGDGDGDGDEVTQSRWWKRGSGGGGGDEKVAPP
jgi:hypothetical protein